MNRNSISYDNKNKKIFSIDKILVYKKGQYGKYNLFKHFIGYNDNNVIRPLCLFIPKIIGYIYIYENNKLTMAFMVKHKQLLENYKKNIGENWRINRCRFWKQGYLY